MLIPEDKISEVLNASDIVDVVSEAVILKRSGRNYFGLCPFHSEKTPSFSVNPEKQIFHCFGCSAGGNALSFIMKYHGISFPEAVRMLARKYNIVVETQEMNPAQRKEVQIRESLFRLNKRVMAFYSEKMEESRADTGVKGYLERRGMTAETIETFKLGYSPDDWDAVVTLFKKEKLSRNIAVNSGLVLPRKSGNGFYDRFRNRLMFPIFDINMQVAGFGGRVMDDGMPKYMNSPETPVYSKSRILYGLHAAKTECRKQGKVFIVEGYFDFLSLFQHGIKNTVASLGTALTREHVRILKGYAGQMVLVFDSDDAGVNAAKRSIDIFVNEGIDTRILVLPGKNDPDSFVMSQGREAFLALADKAQTVLQFLLQLAMETHGASVEGRIKILDEMKGHLAQLSNSALRSLHVRELAETLNIDEKAVLEKVREAVSGQNRQKVPLVPAEETEVMQILESDPREKQILAMMLHHPDLIPEVIEKKVIDAFNSQDLKSLAMLIVDTPRDCENFVTAVMARIGSTKGQEDIAAMAMEDFSGTEDLGETAGALITRILKSKEKNDKILRISKIRSAGKGCNADVMDLLKKQQQEIQQLHNS
ncbi:MAG: DNA primase [Desulfobacter sp.]|nr:MAG: DNA primase [Desulfobacter sp.]